jgi:hypothetical protein
MLEVALPKWIVFPRYRVDAEPLLTPRSTVQTAIQLIENAFNYNVLGEVGFDVVTGLVERCRCYDFCYSRLTDALEVFELLADGGFD